MLCCIVLFTLFLSCVVCTLDGEIVAPMSTPGPESVQYNDAKVHYVHTNDPTSYCSCTNMQCTVTVCINQRLRVKYKVYNANDGKLAMRRTTVDEMSGVGDCIGRVKTTSSCRDEEDLGMRKLSTGKNDRVCSGTTHAVLTTPYRSTTSPSIRGYDGA
jgi:hypothetical protein